MPFTYDIAELERAATEKQARVRDAIRANVPLTLDQLQTDMQGKAPSFGVLLKRRLHANAKKARRRTPLVGKIINVK